MKDRLANTEILEDKNKPLTRMQRKRKRIFGEAGSMTRTFFTGFAFGGLIGGCFGSVFGIFAAWQYRSMALIPVMALSSGCSFGFFMGIGQVIRSGEMAPNDKKEDETYSVVMISPDGRLIKRPAYAQYQDFYE